MTTTRATLEDLIDTLMAHQPPAPTQWWRTHARYAIGTPAGRGALAEVTALKAQGPQARHAVVRNEIVIEVYR